MKVRYSKFLGNVTKINEFNSCEICRRSQSNLTFARKKYRMDTRIRVDHYIPPTSVRFQSSDHQTKGYFHSSKFTAYIPVQSHQIHGTFSVLRPRLSCTFPAPRSLRYHPTGHQIHSTFPVLRPSD